MNTISCAQNSDRYCSFCTRRQWSFGFTASYWPPNSICHGLMQRYSMYVQHGLSGISTNEERCAHTHRPEPTRHSRTTPPHRSPSNCLGCPKGFPRSGWQPALVKPLPPLNKGHGGVIAEMTMERVSTLHVLVFECSCFPLLIAPVSTYTITHLT